MALSDESVGVGGRAVADGSGPPASAAAARRPCRWSHGPRIARHDWGRRRRHVVSLHPRENQVDTAYSPSRTAQSAGVVASIASSLGPVGSPPGLVDRCDDYGRLLASGHVVHRLEDVKDIEAWRAEIRRNSRADKIKVRTGFTNGIVWALRARATRPEWQAEVQSTVQ
jgi:hypothetical protein